MLSARKDLILAPRPRPPAHGVRVGEAEARPSCFAGVYGPQDSVCLQSRLCCWGLGGGGGGVEKLLGQEWTAFSGCPRW